MRVGLIDVDGRTFPNLALMKISTFHKRQGHDVSWLDYFYSYDKVYKSKIFTFSHEDTTHISCDTVERGGTGFDVKKRLPEEVEKIVDPDYSLYPDYKFSIQFFSRGCIRKCSFCLVREKEGFIHPVEPMNLNPNGKHIEVLDNNFFANKHYRDAIEWLVKAGQPVNLHGVDVRIMNEEQAFHLNRLKLHKQVHVAWDDIRDDIEPKLKNMVKYVKPSKICCYVLVGNGTTIEEDMHRIMKIKELGIDPFVMPFRDYEDKRIVPQYEKDLASWVNKKQRFKSFDFKDYRPRKNFKCSEYFKNSNVDVT